MDFKSASQSCFREGFTYKFCCDRAKPRGEPSCWDQDFTFEDCCQLPLVGPAGAVFEDVNCERTGYSATSSGRTTGTWPWLRAELQRLSEAFALGQFPQDAARRWLRRLHGPSGVAATRVGGCSMGQLTLAVARVLLCLLAGDRDCQKHWDQAAQAFRLDRLDLVLWSASAWPVTDLLRPLTRMVAHEEMDAACLEADPMMDWPLAFRAARNLPDDELQHQVWRMISADEVSIQALLSSRCRAGAQWATLVKLGFCMDMAPNCVKSHVFALEFIMREAATGGGLRRWMAEAGAWRLFEVHYGTVKTRVRHRYNLGLAPADLRALGVLGDGAVRGCLLPSFPSSTSEQVAYYLMDPEPNLVNVALNRCRALCGQAFARPWKFYGILPERNEGAFRGIPCACSGLDHRAEGNCTPPEVPLFSMPREVRSAEDGPQALLGSHLVPLLDPKAPVFVTMVFGKMSKYIKPFSERVRSLEIPNVVVFALDESTEDACRRNGVLFMSGRERTALQKYVIVLVFVALGFDSFWFDFDSVWLKNPWPVLQQALAAEEADAAREGRSEALLFSAIDYDSTNCAMNGFFFVRAFPDALSWLIALLDWIHKRPFVHDQLAFGLFLGTTPLVDEEPIPMAPAWAPLDPKVFANAARFDGTGFTSEVDDLVLFHFFDGWNSNSPEGVEQWATATYRGLDLFPLLYGDPQVARDTIARSRLPEVQELRSCSALAEFGLGTKVISSRIQVTI